MNATVLQTRQRTGEVALLAEMNGSYLICESIGPEFASPGDVIQGDFSAIGPIWVECYADGELDANPVTLHGYLRSIHRDRLAAQNDFAPLRVKKGTT